MDESILPPTPTSIEESKFSKQADSTFLQSNFSEQSVSIRLNPTNSAQHEWKVESEISPTQPQYLAETEGNRNAQFDSDRRAEIISWVKNLEDPISDDIFPDIDSSQNQSDSLKTALCRALKRPRDQTHQITAESNNVQSNSPASLEEDENSKVFSVFTVESKNSSVFKLDRSWSSLPSNEAASEPIQNDQSQPQSHELFQKNDSSTSLNFEAMYKPWANPLSQKTEDRMALNVNSQSQYQSMLQKIDTQSNSSLFSGISESSTKEHENSNISKLYSLWGSSPSDSTVSEQIPIFQPLKQNLDTIQTNNSAGSSTHLSVPNSYKLWNNMPSNENVKEPTPIIQPVSQNHKLIQRSNMRPDPSHTNVSDSYGSWGSLLLNGSSSEKTTHVQQSTQNDILDRNDAQSNPSRLLEDKDDSNIRNFCSSYGRLPINEPTREETLINYPLLQIQNMLCENSMQFGPSKHAHFSNSYGPWDSLLLNGLSDSKASNIQQRTQNHDYLQRNNSQTNSSISSVGLTSSSKQNESLNHQLRSSWDSLPSNEFTSKQLSDIHQLLSQNYDILKKNDGKSRSSIPTDSKPPTKSHKHSNAKKVKSSRKILSSNRMGNEQSQNVQVLSQTHDMFKKYDLQHSSSAYTEAFKLSTKPPKDSDVEKPSSLWESLLSNEIEGKQTMNIQKQKKQPIVFQRNDMQLGSSTYMNVTDTKGSRCGISSNDSHKHNLLQMNLPLFNSSTSTNVLNSYGLWSSQSSIGTVAQQALTLQPYSLNHHMIQNNDAQPSLSTYPSGSQNQNVPAHFNICTLCWSKPVKSGSIYCLCCNPLF